MIKVCIIASQILGQHKIGGFGSMTKKLAQSLPKDQFEVVIAVPAMEGKVGEERRPEFTVYHVEKKSLNSQKIFKQINADIYHSQNPTHLTYVAQKAEPNKKHVITCRDPRDFSDWINEFTNATWQRRLKIPLNYAFEASPAITSSIRNADVVGCPAYFLTDKVQKMYRLKEKPQFLPNIESIPDSIPSKSATPTVCFVGRLDKRKHPEKFIELAGQFPQISFIIVGKSEEESWQKYLEDLASQYNNIEMTGFIDKFGSNRLYEIYNKAWVLVNTSSREGLPLTFIEAAGRGCAIMSSLDPDSFASKFGHLVKNNDYEAGLIRLLNKNHWQHAGRAAFNYVKKKYSQDAALDHHINLYKSLLSS